MVKVVANMAMIIYPSITSISKNGAFEKLKEVNQLKLTTISFFPTGLSATERQAFYQQLKTSSVKKIACLHLRNDMQKKEINWLIKTYQVDYLNIHPQGSLYPFNLDLSFCRDQIYIENSFTLIQEEELKKYAGLCLDFAHLENDRLLRLRVYLEINKLIKRTKVGWAHIGAITAKPYLSPISNRLTHDNHFFTSLSQFDYLKKYRPILPFVLALELENNIKQQLEVKQYLEKIL